jgi:hypothetical protein
VIGVIVWLLPSASTTARQPRGLGRTCGSGRSVSNRDIADYLTEVDALRVAAGRERQKSLLNAPLADADD